jgi:putative hydrolase of the HAD superfamily
MKIEALFFDLDGTLYQDVVGVWNAISVRMNDFMHKELGIPIEKVSDIREGYFHKYGTTLRGIQHHYDIDPKEYLSYVHDVPVNEFIKPDPQLRELLIKNSLPKWIVTNSDKNHSMRVLDALGIRDQFKDIIDVWATGYNPKPSPHFYKTTLKISGLTSPEPIIFFDDIQQNVLGAKTFGFIPVLVGEGIIADGIDNQIDKIHDFPKIIKDLTNANV